jgi:hypothetical protein
MIRPAYAYLTEAREELAEWAAREGGVRSTENPEDRLLTDTDIGDAKSVHPDDEAATVSPHGDSVRATHLRTNDRQMVLSTAMMA